MSTETSERVRFDLSTHFKDLCDCVTVPECLEQQRQILTRYASAARLEEAEAAIANVQEAIDIWKSWNTDDGYEAMNTGILIRERLKARAAQQKAQGEGT